jgi:hypothetical protein
MLNNADHVAADFAPSPNPEASHTAINDHNESPPRAQSSRARSAVLTHDQVDAAASALRALRMVRPLTPRDALAKLAPQIKAAQQRGCKIDQIVEQLRASGIAASASSVRRALRETGASNGASGKAGAKVTP